MGSTLDWKKVMKNFFRIKDLGQEIIATIPKELSIKVQGKFDGAPAYLIIEGPLNIAHVFLKEIVTEIETN